MKTESIIYCSASTVPGTANSVHVLKMCSALAGLGANVDLLLYSPRGVRRTPLSELSSMYGLHAKFNLIYMFKSRNSVSWNLNALLYALYVLFRSIRRKSAIYGRNLRILCFLVLMGKKAVMELHEPPDNCGVFISKLLKYLIRSRELYIVVITDSLKRELIKYNPAMSDRIYVLPDAADYHDTSSLDSFDCDMGEFSIVYVGGLYKGKGLEIIKDLSKKCSWATFHVIGDDINVHDKVSYPSNVRFHGYIDHAGTDAYRLSADVLIAPYQKRVFALANKEASSWMSPLKLFEYMSAGKPILASDLPVLHEVLTDRVNSILCDPDSIDDWVVALNELRGDSELRERIAKNAFMDFENKYTWRKRASDLLFWLNSI